MTARSSSLDHLDNSLEEMAIAIDSLARRKERLYTTAFTDRERAMTAENALVTTRGVGEAIRILGNHESWSFMWHFGSLKGGFLEPGARKAAREALEQLPDAIRTHHELIARRKDLLYAREQALEREQREFFVRREQDRQVGRENDRPESRTRQWRRGRH